MGMRESTIEERFASRIKLERQIKGWSQADLAKRMTDAGLRVHPTTIAKIEAGDRAIRLEEAATFARIFETPLDDLIGQHVGFQQQVALDTLIAAARNAIDQVGQIIDQLDYAYSGLRIGEKDLDEWANDEARNAQIEEAGMALTRSLLMPIPFTTAQHSLEDSQQRLRSLIHWATLPEEEIERTLNSTSPHSTSRNFIERVVRDRAKNAPAGEQQ